MRSVDERVAAVQRRAKRLRRRRTDRVLAAAACLMVLPLVGLMGSYATSNLVLPTATDAGLFGTASLFGASAGGYVLVAVASFVAAVALTLFIVLRRRRSIENDEMECKDVRNDQE